MCDFGVRYCYNINMSKSIYINIITKDLEKSTAFYEAIGCIKNPMFSNDVASALVWSEEIIFMILKLISTKYDFHL